MTRTFAPGGPVAALVLGLALAAGSASGALAQSKPIGISAWPKIGFETEVDLEYDHVKPEHLDAGGALNLQASQQTLLEFDNHWSVSNLLTLEPMQDPVPGKEKFLQDHGLFAEELFGQWTNQLVRVKFGKFAQNFARAWYLTPGLYGQDFVGDYAIAETWSVEGQVQIAPETWGLHQVSVSAFEDDRTFLSRSAFYDRGRLTYDAGGPGNTHGLKSFVVSYDATNVPLGPVALDYQLSAASLGKGFGGDKAERRGSVGFDINAPLKGGVNETLRGRFSELRLIGEGVELRDADGLAGQSRKYLTGAVEYVTGQWVFDLTATDRWSEAPGVPDLHDRLRSFAIGYSLPSDTVVAIGLAKETVGGEDSTFAGIQVSQTLTTCDRCLIRSRHY